MKYRLEPVPTGLRFKILGTLGPPQTADLNGVGQQFYGWARLKMPPDIPSCPPQLSSLEATLARLTQGPTDSLMQLFSERFRPFCYFLMMFSAVELNLLTPWPCSLPFPAHLSTSVISQPLSSLNLCHLFLFHLRVLFILCFLMLGPSAGPHSVCSFSYSFIHSLIHSLSHMLSISPSFTHSFAAPTHPNVPCSPSPLVRPPS